MGYEQEKNLIKAKLRKLERTGLPMDKAKPTTETDVNAAKEAHRDRTYAAGLDKNKS